jgi:DNA repair protein RecO (recombination protein O)
MSRSLRIDRQSAWVLHRRPLRETSVLLDLLTREHGRVGVVARAARGSPRGHGVVCQPFQPLVVSWSGRGELKTLTAAERTASVPAMVGERLYSALYVNEMLVRALAPHDAHPVLFDAYGALVRGLPEAELEPLLRGFELLLLGELGYAPDFAVDAGSGELMEPQGMYSFAPAAGFLASPGAPESTAYPGWSLEAIGRRDFSDPRTRRFAKRLLREALAPVLGDRPLRSREYFRRAGTHAAD